MPHFPDILRHGDPTPSMMEPLDDGGLIFLRGDLATLSTLQRLERGLGFVVEGLGFFVGGMPAALRPQERLERGEGQGCWN